MSKRTLATELDSDHRILFTINNNCRRHLNVRILKFSHIFFPAINIKLNEDCSQYFRVIQSPIIVGLYVFQRDSGTRASFHLLSSSSTPHTGRAAATGIIRYLFQRFLSLSRIQISVFVGIKLFSQLQNRTIHTSTARAATWTSASRAFRTSLHTHLR